MERLLSSHNNKTFENTISDSNPDPESTPSSQMMKFSSSGSVDRISESEAVSLDLPPLLDDENSTVQSSSTTSSSPTMPVSYCFMKLPGLQVPQSLGFQIPQSSEFQMLQLSEV